MVAFTAGLVIFALLRSGRVACLAHRRLAAVVNSAAARSRLRSCLRSRSSVAVAVPGAGETFETLRQIDELQVRRPVHTISHPRRSR